jgi:hypothetical protein
MNNRTTAAAKDIAQYLIKNDREDILARAVIRLRRENLEQRLRERLQTVRKNIDNEPTTRPDKPSYSQRNRLQHIS